MVGGIRHMRLGMALALMAGPGLGHILGGEILRPPRAAEPDPEPRAPREPAPAPVADPPAPIEPTAADLSAMSAAEAKRARRNARRREVSA